MLLYQQSEATAAQRRVFLHLVDATDGITPETGEGGGQPQVSENGAAFGNTSGTLVHVGNGLYYVELIGTELDTLGIVAVRFKSAATAEAQVIAQVVPWDPYDAVRQGMTALPNAAAEAAGGLYTRGAGAGQINQNANGQVDTRTVAMAADVVTAAAIATAAIDADSIAANAITAAKINAAAITAAKFAVGAIDASAIATDAITNTKIAAGAITVSEAPNLDALVSSRATQAQILSDATPFPGASIDATISSRGTADPGDAMALTVAAIDLIWDELVAAARVAGSFGQLLKDNINATIASRATQAQILSDATPFPGASIDAAISTRGTADPGDAMGLVANAVDGTSLADGTITAAKAPNLDAAVSSRATPVQVNAEVVDVLKVDTIAERAQGIPPTTPTFEQLVSYLYMALTKQVDVTSGFKKIHNNADVVIAQKVLTDDGTTYREAKMISGP